MTWLFAMSYDTDAETDKSTNIDYTYLVNIEVRCSVGLANQMADLPQLCAAMTSTGHKPPIG